MVVLPPPVGPTKAATCPGSILKLTSSRIDLIRAVAERHVVEFDRALERGRPTRVGQVAHAAFGLQHFAYPLESDAGLRDGVGHLRQVPHGLVHLSQVEQKDDQRAGGQLPRDDQPRAVPEHQAGPDRDDDLDDGRELHLDASRQQRRLDILQALALESALLVVLAGKGLDHANRREDLLDDRDQLALLLLDVARRLLDAPREDVHDQEEHRRDGERDQREAPVQVQHDADDAHQGQDVGHDAEERRGDEVLNAVDVARDPADEVAGALLVVFGERQAMNVVIERPPQVVHHPLADAGGEVVFR